MQKAVEMAHAVLESYWTTGPEVVAEALTAALASLEADGWKLMPREATKEILAAIERAHEDAGCMFYEGAEGKNIYTAMFNAAPEVD